MRIFCNRKPSLARISSLAGILIPLFFLYLPLFAEDVVPPPPTETTVPSASIVSTSGGVKDYFQPMVTGVKYQYEYLETKSQKILAEYSAQTNLRSFRTMEFLQSEVLADGGVKATYRHLEYSLSDSAPMTMVDNSLTFLLNADTIKNVTDLGDGKLYEDGFDVKMPQQDQAVTWVNVFHGDLSNIGGEPYQIEKSNKAYFGKCETKYGVYPDCIIVEEIDPGSDKDTLTKTYYAKSIGRVKDEYFNRDKKKLRVDTAKALYGKSWKTEMNKHNKNLMKWVDNGTSVLAKIEKISGTLK